MILLCNPHNPVGRVWTKAELERMVALAEKYKVMIISDEVHADIVFEGSTFTSMTSLGYENSLTIIGSPAKNFGLNSISNGYIYSDNQALFEKIKATSASLSIDHGNAFTTYATIAAYQQGKEWFEGFYAYTQNNRNWIIEFIEFIEHNLPLVKAFPPQGTNQIWLDFSGLELEPSQLKTLLTEEAKMALTPGTWFGEPNENYYRMNFACSLEQIQTSFELLKAAVDKRK
nr:aminotransferase class I/II-fold pyridoxal phosphate-dependent enzyme [Vibrio harveyi]